MQKIKYLKEILKHKDNLGSFQGCSIAEIDTIKKSFDFSLSVAYLEFLQIFGKNTGYLLNGYSMTFDKLEKNRNIAIYELNFDENFSLKNQPILKENYIFIAQWQGYNFFYIDCEEASNNPPVYLFDTERISIYKNSFTEFILNEYLLSTQSL